LVFGFKELFQTWVGVKIEKPLSPFNRLKYYAYNNILAITEKLACMVNETGFNTCPTENRA